MHKLLLIIILAFFIDEQSFASEWEIVSEMPIPVMGGQAVVNDGLIYIVGGYTDSTYSALNIIQAYNPVLNSWEILPDTLAIPRYGLTAVNNENYCIFFGGNSGQDTINFSLEMWDYDAQPFIYSVHANFGRNFATAQLYEDDLFLFGGQIYNLIDSLQSAYIVQYNIPQDSIIFLSDTLFTEVLPLQQMSAFLNEKIYIFGGAYNGVLNTIYCFNPQTVTWDGEIYNMIEKRAGGTCLVINEETILIIGGYNEHDNAIASTEVFSKFSPEYYSVDYYAFLNIGRTELMAANIDSEIYVFGGKNSDGECVAFVEKSFFENNHTLISGPAIPNPNTFMLGNNYPNPFNPKTKITYQISSNGLSPVHVRLSIYDILGNEVAVLIDDYQTSGVYEIEWDAIGKASGIYFYRLSTDMGQQTKSMLLIR